MNNLYGFDLGNRELPKMEARVLPWVYARGDRSLSTDHPLTKDSLVYEVGGYQGDWASAIHDIYGCRVKVFEPVDFFVKKLEELFEGKSKVKIYPFGLGATDTKMKIGVDWEASSVFKPGDKTETIKIVDVSKVVAGDQIDLMQINIEGGEYEMLNKLIDTGQISQIKHIQVQFHDFVPNAVAKRKEMQERLQKTHHLTYCYPFVWENWERNT